VSELRPEPESTLGNGARSRTYSLRTYHQWPNAKRAIHFCAFGRSAAARNEERVWRIRGVDFIDFDSQLNDEEKLVRQTARHLSKRNYSHHRKSTAGSHFSETFSPQLANWDFLARICTATARRNVHVAYGLMTQELEPWRLRIAKFCFGAGCAVM